MAEWRNTYPASPALLHAIHGLGRVAAFAMHAPAAAVRDSPGLLYVDVHHMAGVFGDDLPWLTVGLAVWVDEPSPVQAQLGKQSGDGAAADRGADLVKLEGDTGGRPFVLAPHQLDPIYELTGCGGRLAWRRRRRIEETPLALA